jgi:stage II sporulation protein GA (sporulation sigma-E factor processing peptidase)
MPIYLDVLMILNFLVDFLLLIGTNRLAGYPLGVRRALAAGILGGIYGGLCVMPGLTFLAATHWRLGMLALMAMVAFGWRWEAMRRGFLFILLSMALGGIAVGLEKGGFWSLVWSAAALGGLCLFGFRGKVGAQYINVQIEECDFTALVDTGNTLTDPLTGQRIMVVSPKIGERLLHVNEQSLKDPVSLMGLVKGVRLVSFHAVGRSGGILPVKRFENVQIGNWRGSYLVAFSPNELGQGKPYDALTGGGL